MPSGIGYGINIAGASIADAIRRRREASYQNEATRAILNAILAGNQLVDTGTISPEMAAKLAPLGVNLGGTGAPGDVTRTKEQMLSDLLSAVGDKYPAMAGQNLGALMAPQQQLVQERQARSTLEGFSPMVSSVLSPEQMQATIAAGNVDPVAMAEMYKNWTNTLVQNQAGTEGTQLAELGPSGQTLRQQSMEDFKEKTTFDTNERIRAGKELARFSASLKGAGGDKDSDGSMTTKQKVDGLNFNLNAVGNALEANVKARNEINTRIAENRQILQEEGYGDYLGERVFGTVTRENIIEEAARAKLAGLSDKDGFKYIEETLLSRDTGYVGTKEQKEQIFNLLEQTGYIKTSKAQEDFEINAPARSALNNIFVDKIQQSNLDLTEQETREYGNWLVDNASRFLQPGSEGYDMFYINAQRVKSMENVGSSIKPTGGDISFKEGDSILQEIQSSGPPSGFDQFLQKAGELGEKVSSKYTDVTKKYNLNPRAAALKTMPGGVGLGLIEEQKSEASKRANSITDSYVQDAISQIEANTTMISPSFGSMVDNYDKMVQDKGGAPLGEVRRGMLLEALRRKRLEQQRQEQGLR